MNDFFNVLDDFELEEFAPVGEPDSVSTFNLDVDGDTSKGADSWDEDVEYGDAELNKVANTADAITEQNADRYLASDGKYYAWKNGTNPFANSTSTAGVFFSQTGATTTTNASGYEVTELALNNLDGISTLARVAGLVLEKANGKGFELNASAGLSFTLNNGNLTGGKIDAGEGQFTMGEYDADNADAYTKGDITVTVTGFDPPENEDDLVWTGDETNFQSIVTAGTEGGSVAVENDYNFSVDDNEVKLKNVAAGEVVFTYGADGIELNLSDLAQDGTDVINVTSAANAEKLVPPTDPDSNDVAGGSIMIAKKTYEYVLGANSEAYFTLNSNGSVEGFVLDVTGDSITVANNQDINVYDEDLTKLVTVDGSGYTVTKNANNYTLTIANTSEVTIGDTTLDFTIKSALAGGKEINITFDEDGVIESVDGLYNLTSTSDKLVVTGPDADSEEEGLPVINKKGVQQYITVSDGDFTLVGGAAGEQQLVVDAGETVYAAYSGIGQLTTEEQTGQVTDDVNGLTYGYTGKGHFITTSDGIITGFVFESKGDSVTLPEGGEGINLYYLTETAANLIAVPAIADTAGFTVTLSDVTDPTDPQFTISNMSEGATVPANLPLRNPITSWDADDTLTIDLNGIITGIGGLEDSIVLRNGTYEIDINGDTLAYTAANDITVTGDMSTGLAQVSGLVDGDIVSSTDDGTAFVFETDSTDGDSIDVFTVNGKVYTVTNDNDGITITAGGVVTGLDEDAELLVSEGPVTVNGVNYTAEDILKNGAITGYETKKGDISSYIDDPNHPLFRATTTFDDIRGWLGVAYGTDQIFRESNDDDLDRSTDTLPAEVYFDATGNHTSKFNNLGNNLAIVTAAAEGTKNIFLGDHGDAVIMAGIDEYGEVNITGGAGNDTIFVGGRIAEDVVVHEGSMKTNIDLSAGGVDKIHTFAAANANIVLNNYDETSYAGVVIHDPEIPYIKDLVDAIQDELLVFEDGGITAIDRDETYEGVDRKSRITVHNKNTNHQTMIRLFGYKDNPDTYGDDYGQLVGFTGKDGGALDASDIAEDLILIGNRTGNKTAGSSLKSGIGNDTIFGGENDVIEAGTGENQILLDTVTADRGAATIILGEGKDTITGLVSGFNGDILNVDLAAADTDVSFDGTNLVVKNTNDKFSATAAVATEEDFVEQLFVNNNETIKAAIAVEGGTITVGEDAPNFYKAPNGAVDFSAYTGEVTVDMDGDWAQSKVGDDNATFDGMNSLIGGSGNTLFKGGSADETLVAGTGEGSLYGGGGKNNLVGSSSEDKMGSTEFFALGINNGAQNTISGFEFIENGGGNTATFDALTIDMGENGVTDIKANTDGSVTLAIQGNRGEGGATEKVTIENAAGKEFLVDRGTEFETVAQIAATEVTVNNSYVDFYCATDDANGATVKVGDIASTEIWLDAPDYGNGVDFSNSKFTVVDARGSNAEVLAAGNDIANTIYGGAGNASMWGGSGIVNDVMYGGTGHNEFYFEGYNGNDTIMSANDGDVIQLGVTLDQIDFDGTNITATGVEIKLTDGSSLTVNSTAEVNIVLDDGTTAKVNHATQQFE